MHIQSLLLPVLPFLTLTTASPIASASAQTPYPYPTITLAELASILYSTTGSSNPNPDSSSSSSALTRRAGPRQGVFVCTEENFKGNCWWAPAYGKDAQKCTNWDDIRSFGPDNGLACDLFEGKDCKGKMALKFVSFPGEKKTPGKGLRSWRCGSV
jgi:hypothetical protein